MKISGAAVLAMAYLPSTGAFVSTFNKKPIGTTTELNLQVDKQTWVGPTVAALAGMTLASQVAGAAPLDAAAPMVDSVAPIVRQGKNPSVAKWRIYLREQRVDSHGICSSSDSLLQTFNSIRQCSQKHRQ
jgi:hypothetical protein